MCCYMHRRSSSTQWCLFSLVIMFTVSIYSIIYDSCNLLIMYLKMLRDGLEGTPKYSMASRHFLKESERSPGPAAYLPTKWAIANRPPEYTFGMKYRYDKNFITPGECLIHCALSLSLSVCYMSSIRTNFQKCLFFYSYCPS